MIRSVAVVLVAGLGVVACGDGSDGVSRQGLAPPMDKSGAGAVNDGDLDSGGPTRAVAPDAEDEPGSTASVPESTTTDPGPARDAACVGLLRSILWSPDPAVLAEQQLTRRQQEDDLEALAQQGPPEIRDEAQDVLDNLPWLNYFDPSEDVPTDDMRQAAAEILAALDALIDWAASECTIDGLYWGCADVQGLVVAEQPADEGRLTALSPEGAITGDPEGAVEVSRSEDQVLFAWTETRGMVWRVEQVGTTGARGWTSEGDVACP